MRRRYKGKKVLNWKAKLLIAAALAAAVVLGINSVLDSVVDQVAGNYIHNTGSYIINNAIADVLFESGLDQEDMVFLSYDSTNTVTSVQTNSAAVNQVRTKVTAGVLENLRQLDTTPIGIPLGSLTDFRYFQARGPKVEFFIYPTGYMTTKIISSFDDAGINQTRHRLIIEITADITCAGLMQKKSTTVTTEYVLSETIIVGDIPESYSNLLFEGKRLFAAE